MVRTLPCRRSGARGDRQERSDLRIVKLNVDENQQTAASFQVLSIPTMILFKAGEPVKTVVGAYPKKKIKPSSSLRWRRPGTRSETSRRRRRRLIGRSEQRFGASEVVGGWIRSPAKWRGYRSRYPG